MRRVWWNGSSRRRRRHRPSIVRRACLKIARSAPTNGTDDDRARVRGCQTDPMSLNVAPIDSSRLIPPTGPAPARAPQPAPAVDWERPSAAIPSSPPPEVIDAMSAAARAYQELRQMGRELRFFRDEESGRLRIEVRDLDGNVLRTIPPSELLDIATRGGLA